MFGIYERMSSRNSVQGRFFLHNLVFPSPTGYTMLTSFGFRYESRYIDR